MAHYEPNFLSSARFVTRGCLAALLFGIEPFTAITGNIGVESHGVWPKSTSNATKDAISKRGATVFNADMQTCQVLICPSGMAAFVACHNVDDVVFLRALFVVNTCLNDDHTIQ